MIIAFNISFLFAYSQPCAAISGRSMSHSPQPGAAEM